MLREGGRFSEDESDWVLINPINSALYHGNGFVCFHTHNLSWEDVEKADNRSIEIDTQEIGPEIGDYNADIVVSHHPWAYPIYGNNPPKQEKMMRAEEVVMAVKDRIIFVKFDIKSASQRTYDWVVDQAKKLKPENRMLHVFLKELHAVNIQGISDPYKQDAPQTVSELVELNDLKQMKKRLDGIPVQVSCRGFSISDIEKQEGDRFPVIDELCKRVRGVATVINFNLKGGWKDDEKFRAEVMQYVWERYQMMIELNIDEGESAPIGVPFLGRSDNMEKATNINEIRLPQKPK